MEIVHDMPSINYHSHEYLGSHDIQDIGKSISHHIYNKTHHEDKPAYSVGTAFHTFCLEPHKFEEEIKVVECATRRGKVWDAAKGSGKTLILNHEFEMIQKMFSSIQNHPKASNIFAAGEAELSYFWEDEKTGIGLKSRVDWTSQDYLIDLKS